LSGVLAGPVCLAHYLVDFVAKTFTVDFAKSSRAVSIEARRTARIFAPCRSISKLTYVLVLHPNIRVLLKIKSI